MRSFAFRFELSYGALDTFVVSMSGYTDMKSSRETKTIFSAISNMQNHKNSLTEITLHVIKERHVKIEV